MCLSIQPWAALALAACPWGAALALAAACPQIWIDFQKMRVFLEKEVIRPLEAGIGHARVPGGLLACTPRYMTPHRPALWQNWLNGEPTGRCLEHADAEACCEAHAARHDFCNNVSTGITTARASAAAAAICVGPHLELIGGPAIAVPNLT